MKVKSEYFALLSFLLVILPGSGFALPPDVSETVVTDVTTRSFSVCWNASEASTAGIRVFIDEEGMSPVENVTIVPHPTLSENPGLVTRTQDNGVMKVMVSGLEAATTYYYQIVTTSKGSGEVDYEPDSAPFPSVETESRIVRDTVSGEEVVPVTNDLIKKEFYYEDGSTPAEGTVVIASVSGCSYPLSSFVGDGIASPFALIDLNNLFSSSSRQTIKVIGGETIAFLNLRGVFGTSSSSGVLPASTNLAKAVLPLAVAEDRDGDGYPTPVDCDDNDVNINPGASEVCNGKDDDCDTLIDEELTQSCGTGACTGMQTCTGGTWSNCSSYNKVCADCALCSVEGECNIFSSGSLCRPSTGACDVPEYCTGGAPDCPPDASQADGSECEDGNACTVGETCSDGICVGGLPRNCDDGNVCTDDSCDQVTGCVYANNTAFCDDDLYCTLTDTCQDGICVGNGSPCAPPLVCSEERDMCVSATIISLGQECGTACGCIPIVLTNAAGLEVYTINCDIGYSSDALVAKGCLLGPASIAAGKEMSTCDYSTPGTVAIEINSAGGVIGDGIVAYTDFDVLATLGTETLLTLACTANSQGQDVPVTSEGSSKKIIRVGDFNCDGQVTIDEVIRVVRMYLGEDPVSPIADPGCDGEVQIFDVIKCINCYLETEDCTC